MSGEPELRVEDLPAVAGRPGIAQGSYGRLGNLELVCPDPDTGFWVLWWNADPTDARSGARPGAWSGGLHVPTGHRHGSAAITQLRRGPSFLEVVLGGPEGVHRTTWSPEGGFSPVRLLAAGGSPSRLVEPPLGDALHLLVGSPSSALHLHGSATWYPTLDWAAAPLAAVATWPTALAPDGATGLLAVVASAGGLVARRWDPSTGWTERARLGLAGPCVEVELVSLPGGDVLVMVLSADGTLATELLRPDGSTAPAAAPDLRADSFSAAASTVDGGRVELVARTGATLRHTWRGADGTWVEPVAVRSETWADPSLTTVHRRG
jgi:hypothetical protein